MKELISTRIITIKALIIMVTGQDRIQDFVEARPPRP
jgi:hypothetical protein